MANDLSPRRIEKDLSAHYTFSHADARDSTGNNVPGTLNGNAFVTSGYVELDGAGDHVDTNNFFGNGLSDWSVSMWVNADSWSGSRCIFGSSTISPNRYLVLFANGGGLDGVVADGSTVYGFTTGATTLSAATWYHIVYTFSGGSVDAFINTVSDANYPQATGVTAPTVARTQYIGARNHIIGVDLEFDGKIGDVRLYKRALTQAEIQYLYQTTRGDYA